MVVRFDVDERKKIILKAIIQEHIITAEPIGSRTLARNMDLGVSPATIRNEMSDLEEMGYLEQPHTSAGRIPSDKGYRFYVDSLMEQEGMPEDNLQKYITDLIKEKRSLQEIMSGMVKMLSSLTRYTALISEPQFLKSRIKKIQLFPFASDTLVIILITDTGIVNNKIVKLRQEITKKQLRYINRFLVDKLKDKEISSLDRVFLKNIEMELIQKLNLSEELFEFLYKELDRITQSVDFRIFLGGTSYILEQPEFKDFENLKKVLNVLDHEDILRKLISIDFGKDIGVRIGRENELREMQKCSVVYATYYFRNKPIGKIGVIGPTRMKYPRVISAVDLVADVLGKIILKTSR